MMRQEIICTMAAMWLGISVFDYGGDAVQVGLGPNYTASRSTIFARC